MKKFLLQICIYSIVLVTFFQLVFWLMPFSITDRSYPIYKYQKESVNENVDLEVLLVGDSRVVSSLNPNLIPKSKNVGIVGSNPIESYFLLKKYLHNENKKIHTVFISYAWDRFGIKYWPDVFIERGGLFDFYSFSDFQEIVEVAQAIDPEFLNHIRKIDFIQAKLKSPQYVGALMSNSLMLSKKENLRIYEKVKSQLGHVNEIWGYDALCDGCLPDETSLDSFTLKPIYQFYFEKSIELCNQNSVRVMYETIPFNESSKEYFNEKTLNDHSKFIENLTVKYPNNQFSDSIIFVSDAYFDDPHHMNKEGAAYYSSYINLLLQETGN